MKLWSCPYLIHCILLNEQSSRPGVLILGLNAKLTANNLDAVIRSTKVLWPQGEKVCDVTHCMRPPCSSGLA
ncbi:hypothetical protein BHE74_00030967 [Ensete ventricosum]|uniref:Uncharacterized protein n=1 Tax=Ensete ventricosum TaxID=4639 RepID=A0A427A248_ENSVE|nr:hypothetical protein B296_00020128 [Ensete ventricosum]RWW27881.1 hypothetical protein GW17_00007668 [Ensete ventricosum]RWW61939.1 hypothetical protein BHE74_00030967 [Ensete ventricosum]RZS00541.1 hypothetical protein BHM03_00030261 [Ensete ventricosum]